MKKFIIVAVIAIAAVLGSAMPSQAATHHRRHPLTVVKTRVVDGAMQVKFCHREKGWAKFYTTITVKNGVPVITFHRYTCTPWIPTVQF